MPSASVSKTLTLVAFLCLALGSCSGESDTRPVVVMDFTDGGITGCIQPLVPQDEPDLGATTPPRFLLISAAAQQSTSGQATADPGDVIEAEITINDATRQVLVELKDAWDDIPAIITQRIDIDTPGNQTLEVLFATEPDERPSRYYMKITLCGADCNAQEVVFDINPDVNATYERTLIEDGEVVRVDTTCLDFKARPGIGSGTVLMNR